MATFTYELPCGEEAKPDNLMCILEPRMFRDEQERYRIASISGVTKEQAESLKPTICKFWLERTGK